MNKEQLQASAQAALNNASNDLRKDFTGVCAIAMWLTAEAKRLGYTENTNKIYNINGAMERFVDIIAWSA